MQQLYTPAVILNCVKSQGFQLHAFYGSMKAKGVADEMTSAMVAPAKFRFPFIPQHTLTHDAT